MTHSSITFAAPEAGPNPPPQERPEWLPENFTSPEALTESYKNAQAELTRAKQELAALKGEPDPAAPKQTQETPPEEPKPGDNKTQFAGVDLSSYQSEFESTGDVSVDNRQQIADSLKNVLGNDALTIVNQYIDGQKQAAANDTAMYMNEAGGAESYAKMVEWAARNLPKGEQEAYNRMVESKDRSATLVAIRGLRASYEAAEGREGNRIMANRGGAPAPTGFSSSAQMVAAMRDPRYATDPAYRQEIADRLKVSNF